MTRLTLRIDETLLRKARITAKENGTSVNAMIRDLIEKTVIAAAPERISAERFMQLIEQGRFASTGERLSRDEMYDSDPRMQRLLRIGTNTTDKQTG